MKILFLLLAFTFNLIQPVQTESKSKVNQGLSVLPPLSYNILNKGESIKILLNNYFPFAQNYLVQDNNQTGNLSQKLDVQFNLNRTQVQAQQEMSGEMGDSTKVSLNLTKIYDVKSIYNQPNKLFLLQNNILMMYSYRQKSQSSLKQSHQFQQYLYANKINLNQSNSKFTILNISNVARFSNVKHYDLNCTEMEAFPFQGRYKLIVLCKMQIYAPQELRNYLIGLNMDQDNRGFIVNLSFNDSSYIESVSSVYPSKTFHRNPQKLLSILLQNKLLYFKNNEKQNVQRIIQQYLNTYSKNQSSQEYCKDYHLKYFQKLFIAPQDRYNHIVIAFCNSTTNVRPYQIGFFRKRLIIKSLINNSDPNINNCLYSSKYIAEYQNGFLSAIYESIAMRSYLRFFKYEARLNDKGKTQVVCQQYNSVSLMGYLFITSRNQSGVQTVYVIFPDKIYIFQSYSPNYQTLNITYAGLILKSYAISNQMLFLHFENQNSTKYTIMTYNIKSMYPHLIDKVQFPMNNQNDIYFFSVMNYLQSANYFFIYERQSNLLKLVFYEGQYVTISVSNPFNAVGFQNISIMNCSSVQQSQCSLNPQTRILPIHIKIRAFCDSSIEIVPLETIRLNNKLFNIDLVKAVLGPLGRFYKMKNPSTSLQFVNSFHQIDISTILSRFNDKKLITFSIDTFLNDPILTFYFEDFLVLECDLEFDFYLMNPLITRCVEVITQNEQNPEEIIIYEQGRFLQFMEGKIEFCRISSSRDVICVEADMEMEPIKKIKLIEYKQMNEDQDLISVFIIFERKFKQKDYLIKTNATSSKDIQISVNLVITENQIQYLKFMTIRTVEYDEGYQKFLVLYMMDYFNPVNSALQNPQNQLSQHKSNTAQNQSVEQTFFHIVQIYSKPQLQRNQSCNFIGHLIQEFTSNEGEQLENIYIIQNKIIILSIQPNGSTIQQFIIRDFKCQKNRNYPLYDHRITKNGSHSVNSGFLFVQVQEDEVSKFLVYNPSLNTTNIITHSFHKIQNQKLMFIQKITPSENVMAIHGSKLITLSLPNMVIRLNDETNENPLQNRQFFVLEDKQGEKLRIESREALKVGASLDLSFIDNNDILRVISFNYSYEFNDSNIQYSAHIQNEIRFDSFNDSSQIIIDPSQITGPVSEYTIQNHTGLHQYQSNSLENICQFIKLNSSDIFTKTKCIKYIDSKADGIMQDFLTYQSQPYHDITIIVTDIKILCIQNMQVQSSLYKNKTKQCHIFQSQSDIFVVCIEDNTTTINRLEMKGGCAFERVWLPKPDILKYNLFKMVISENKAIFEVPIRSEKNKIYYVTNFFQNKTFDDSLILFKHGSQQEFITKDFTTNGTFLFLLQNGLGIFDLSKINKSSKNITPDAWISENALMKKFQLEEEQDLTYVNCLEFNQKTQDIILQIGTTFQSFQVKFMYKYNETNDSIYVLDEDIIVNYNYKNPWSCYNTLLSKSRYYKNMTIKMCSYMPDEHYIYSNFIPISQNKQNSYIVFYQKNFERNQSYPYRMDIIYTNIYSNDNFQIPMHKAKLLIGSLFNLLCQYDLRDTFKFIFSLDQKLKDLIQDNKNTIEMERKCNYSLKLSNQNTQKTYQFTIKLDFENKNRDYWTDWKHWIQRILFFLIILNFVRLQFLKRSQNARLSKLKIKAGRSNSFDQTFDLHVRLNSKKSL